jgi:uncharacterized membrane protein YqhA
VRVTVFYIIALGLYELFVDDRVELPQWLIIRNIDDLKNKLAGVVVVVMAVLFRGRWFPGTGSATCLATAWRSRLSSRHSRISSA